MSLSPFESAKDGILTEILRHAEIRLEDQLSAATAADQRALTFAGLLVASIAAIVTISTAVPADAAALCLTVSTMLGIAAAAALWSARPTAWSFRGTSPAEWVSDITNDVSVKKSNAEMAAHYAGAIGRNAAALQSAAKAMRFSMAVTAASVAVALAWSWVALLT